MQRLIILKNTDDAYVEHHVLDEPFDAIAWVRKNQRRLKALRVAAVLDYAVDGSGRVPDGSTVYEQLLTDGMPTPIKH